MSEDIELYNVNGSVVLTGKIRKANKALLYKPLNFYMRPLNVKDAHAMGDLSACIYDGLEAGQECFIHKHDKQYFKNVFQNDNIQYIGAFVGKELIAMSYFHSVRDAQELQEELPNHGLDFANSERLQKLGVENAQIAAFGADSVHPDFRGNNLNSTMVKYRVALAKQKGFSDCVSIIDRNNIWNMNPYFSNGFNMFSSAVDPADGGKIALLHRPLAEKVRVAQNVRAIRFNDFAEIDGMMNKDFVGIGYDKESKNIAFIKTDFYKNLRVGKKQKAKLNQQVFALRRAY